MSQHDYDLFVIGAGSGGVRAARMAAEFGAKTAIAEESRVGGTCVIRGCVPKKLFVYASHYHEEFEDAAAYGWTIPAPQFSWPSLVAAKDKEIDRLNKIYIANLARAGVELFSERAVLEGAHSIRLLKSGRTLSARHVLLAAGARPFVPDLPGHEHVISSDEAFHLETLPPHIVVVGGGYIAVEFAGIFNGLGVDTTLLYRGEEILRGFDDDLRTHLHASMTAKGIDVRVQSDPAAVHKKGNGYEVELKSGETIATGLVMFATGRRPYTSDLGLEKAGITPERNGAIPVDAYSQTSAKTIYAVGDVTNRVNLTPVAIREGAAFARTVFAGKKQAVDHSLIPSAVFSQPALGTVGLSEAKAREMHGEVDVYKTAFRSLKHTLTSNPEQVLMKLVVHPQSDKVLGVHIAGGDAGELIQALGIALTCGATKAQFDATIAVHPTSAEELVTMPAKS